MLLWVPFTYAMKRNRDVNGWSFTEKWNNDITSDCIFCKGTLMIQLESHHLLSSVVKEYPHCRSKLKAKLQVRVPRLKCEKW